MPVPTAASEGEEVQRLIDSLNTQYQKIEDYQVRITVSIKLPGFRMPRKRMTLSFKQPDRTHLKSRGFAMLPRRAILPSPDTLFSSLANLVIMPSAGGGRCHCVIVRGETVLDPGPALVTEVTIDTVRWVVLGISTSLEDAAVLDLQTEYLEVELGIFMPLKTSIKFELAEDFLTRGSRRRLRGVTAPAGEDLSAMNDGDPDKMPRSGEAVIEFSRYRVNRGLKDSLFEK
ncbi:MAG: hypothetical protein IID15_07505 [Candidatus Marinimicrobia bacterium]|nr:hypothetical protein [Candidatus Neomarinimicrobiota bacterium]